MDGPGGVGVTLEAEGAGGGDGAADPDGIAPAAFADTDACVTGALARASRQGFSKVSLTFSVRVVGSSMPAIQLTLPLNT